MLSNLVSLKMAASLVDILSKCIDMSTGLMFLYKGESSAMGAKNGLDPPIIEPMMSVLRRDQLRASRESWMHLDILIDLTFHDTFQSEILQTTSSPHHLCQSICMCNPATEVTSE